MSDIEQVEHTRYANPDDFKWRKTEDGLGVRISEYGVILDNPDKHLDELYIPRRSKGCLLQK